MEAVIAIVGIVVAAGAALGGAVVGAHATRKSAEAAAAAAEQIAHVTRAEEIRRLAAQGYTDACFAVEWLKGNRVEDSVLPGFREEMEPEYFERTVRLRRGRDVLSEVAALAQPLAEHARPCAQRLGQLDEAWHDGRSYARRYHSLSERGAPNSGWFSERMEEKCEEIDALRGSLLGQPVNELGEPVDERPVHPDASERSGGLLDGLRAAIAELEQQPRSR